jgi:hypothetical protein
MNSNLEGKDAPPFRAATIHHRWTIVTAIIAFTACLGKNMDGVYSRSGID